MARKFLNSVTTWGGLHRVPILLAAITVLATIVSLNLIRSAPFFWSVLNHRFGAAESFQLQTLFRPGARSDIPALIIGDTLFQTRVGPVAGARRIVQNDLDADDVTGILTGIRRGEASSDVRVCAIVLQTSPLYMVRARPMGGGSQKYFLTRTSLSGLLNPLATGETFQIIEAWASVPATGVVDDAPHGRISRHVGQARFSDPSFENWSRIENGLNAYRGRVFMVVDTRFTDFGEGSDLIDVMDRKLEELVASSNRITRLGLDDTDGIGSDLCRPVL